MLNLRSASLVAAVAFLASLPCRADLLTNTQLTSGLQILASGNLYSPSTQILNTGLTTFSFSIPTVMTITAQVNITAHGDTLTLQDTVMTGQVGYGWTQTFTDSIFTNFYPALVSSNYPSAAGGQNGIQFSQTGTTMTFSWLGTGQVSQPTTYTATFNLIDPPPSVPEPPITLLFAAGLLTTGVFALRRKSNSRDR